MDSVSVAWGARCAKRCVGKQPGQAAVHETSSLEVQWTTTVERRPYFLNTRGPDGVLVDACIHRSKASLASTNHSAHCFSFLSFVGIVIGFGTRS